jgi:hypothetical protein
MGSEEWLVRIKCKDTKKALKVLRALNIFLKGYN